MFFLFFFQYYKDDWPWARFWLFSLLTIQIIFSCTILIFWAVRLVKKGKSLAKKDSQKSNDSDVTGKSLSEALIFESTNPQYDERLFIELQIQYMKIPSSEHEENMLCTEIVFDIQNNLCKQHVLSL